MHRLVGTTHGSRQILDSRVRASSGGHPVLEFFTRCRCGAEKWVRAGNLQKSKQCRACTNAERTLAAATWTSHPLFPTWWGISARCHSRSHPSYPRYGGRGIYVCSEWRYLGTRGDRRRFLRFLDDMGPKPSPEHSVDRIDNDGPYEPENCRWATREAQQNNRRDNQVGAWNGKTQTLRQWARELGVSPAKLETPMRLHGMSLEDILPRVTQARAKWVERRRYPRMRTLAEQHAARQWEAEFDAALAGLT